MGRHGRDRNKEVTAGALPDAQRALGDVNLIFSDVDLIFTASYALSCTASETPAFSSTDSFIKLSNAQSFRDINELRLQDAYFLIE